MHVVHASVRDEGVLVLFADGSFSVYSPALLYGSRELAMAMSGLEGRELATLMPLTKGWRVALVADGWPRVR